MIMSNSELRDAVNSAKAGAESLNKTIAANAAQLYIELIKIQRYRALGFADQGITSEMMKDRTEEKVESNSISKRQLNNEKVKLLDEVKELILGEISFSGPQERLLDDIDRLRLKIRLETKASK